MLIIKLLPAAMIGAEGFISLIKKERLLSQLFQLLPLSQRFGLERANVRHI